MGWFLVAVILAGLTAYFLYATMQEGKSKKAQRAVESGDLDTALSIFMDALRQDPDNIDALWHLGNINEEKGLLPEAIGYYVKLIEIGKESKLFTLFELYRRVGMLYRRLGRDNDALDYLLQAYQIIPSAKDVIREIADILFSQKAYFRALNFYEKGAAFLKDEAPFLKQYAFCLLMTDRVEQALPMLEALDKPLGRDLEFLFLLSYAYFRTAAYQRAREVMEIALNSNLSPAMSMMYFGVKLLFVCYLHAKNYDVAKQLWDQLKNMVMTYADDSGNRQRELSMALIMLRVKQGYYDNALDELRMNFQKEIAEANSDGGTTMESKQNQSYLYKLLSTLDKWKKEQEKETYMGVSMRQTLDYARLENEAKEALVKLDTVYQQWLASFLTKEELWMNFRPRVSVTFDPVPILEKYLVPKDVVRKKGETVSSRVSAKQGKYEALGVQPDNPCSALLSIDFPSFTMVARELAADMGFRILSQVVKVDANAYGEGKGFDLLCEEKTDKRSRVLFCLRRWTEPIGSIYLTNLLASAKEFGVERVVMVSTSPLSPEAIRWLETNPKIQYLPCEDVTSFLLN
ncbi:MAG: tetratricopeptide repeat protein [Brevinematales bacterium]|nr:tetratricopeptide repeat protein [Brevinematales bacterium]